MLWLMVPRDDKLTGAQRPMHEEQRLIREYAQHFTFVDVRSKEKEGQESK